MSYTLLGADGWPYRSDLKGQWAATGAIGYQRPAAGV
jgi:hypothetical protein